METPSEQAQIAEFLFEVFAHLDRTVEFQHRPMSPENRWLSQDAPIVQVIFPDDIVSQRPIDALFVTAHGINQVYRRSNFVDAAVTVLQTISEADIAESILRYVDHLCAAVLGGGREAGDCTRIRKSGELYNKKPTPLFGSGGVALRGVALGAEAPPRSGFALVVANAPLSPLACCHPNSVRPPRRRPVLQGRGCSGRRRLARAGESKLLG